jgi:DNA-binding transcriptional LysR family regulator
MRLDKFDLNLLVALNALLEERSVTRAAERLNLTQPAMSAALRRLRESFNDELLAVNGKQMIPTPHAQNLAPLVSQMIVSAQALIASSTLFDPKTSRRVFRIHASDYITTILIRPLTIELSTLAPGVRLEILPLHPNMRPELDRGTIDVIIAPEQFHFRDHPAEFLFEERHVLLGWDANPMFDGPISVEDYESASHVVVELADTRSFAEEFMRAHGDRRRIDVVVPSFTNVPWLLPETNRIAIVHERLAKLFVGKLPLKIAELPFEMPRMREMAQFHRARSADKGLVWLKERLHRHAV